MKYEWTTEDATTIGKWMAEIEMALKAIGIAAILLACCAVAALVTWWLK